MKKELKPTEFPDEYNSDQDPVPNGNEDESLAELGIGYDGESLIELDVTDTLTNWLERMLGTDLSNEMKSAIDDAAFEYASKFDRNQIEALLGFFLIALVPVLLGLLELLGDLTTELMVIASFLPCCSALTILASMIASRMSANAHRIRLTQLLTTANAPEYLLSPSELKAYGQSLFATQQRAARLKRE